MECVLSAYGYRVMSVRMFVRMCIQICMVPVWLVFVCMRSCKTENAEYVLVGL